MTSTNQPDGGRRSVGAATLSKVLALIEAVAGNSRPVGVSELARRSDLPKSTVHRLLAVLHLSGLLERIGRQYLIGSRLLQLIAVIYQRDGLHHRMLPFLAELYAQTHGSVDLSVLRGHDVLCLERITTDSGRHREPAIGQTVPADRCVAGKVLLAFDDTAAEHYLCGNQPANRLSDPERQATLQSELVRIRRRGVALSRPHGPEGMLSIAAPVIDALGRPVAAISITGAMPHAHEAWMVGLLRHTARAASASVSGVPDTRTFRSGYTSHRWVPPNDVRVHVGAVSR